MLRHIPASSKSWHAVQRALGLPSEPATANQAAIRSPKNARQHCNGECYHDKFRLMHRHALRLLLLFLPAAAGFAERFAFQHYAQEQGLTNLTPQCLLQDRSGFLWVGTQNGLFRFDGKSFVRFGTKQGLPVPGIETLLETDDGTLWVATPSALFRRKASVLDSVPFEPVTLPDGVGVLRPNGLGSDRRGRIFVGTDTGLLVGTPQGANVQFQRISLPVERSTAAGLFVDNSDRVWLWCGTRVCQFENGAVKVVSRDLGIVQNRAASLLMDREGNLWARTALNLFLLPKGKQDFVSMDDGLPASNSFSKLYLDRDGKLLVPTDLGLASRNGDRWRILGKEQGLRSSSTTAVLHDREGSVWIGLGGTGLTRWKGYGQWSAWTSEDGLQNDNVWAVTRDAHGTLWAGNDVGLFSFDEKARVWKRFRLGSAMTIDTIVPDPDGTIWVGSSSGLLARVNGSTQSMLLFGPDQGLENDHIVDIRFDAGGRLWVCTRQGLFVSPKPGRQARFAEIVPPGIKSNGLYRRMLVDKAGDLWFGGRGELLRLSGSKWNQYTARDGLKNADIERLAQTPDGTIWLAYRTFSDIGKLRIVGEGIQVQHVPPEIARKPELTVGLATDAKGRLWRTTDEGVFLSNGQSWRQYSSEDGLVWDDCNGNSFYADNDDSVWIGTSMGLAHFKIPTVEFPNASQPLITGFTLGDEERTQLNGLTVPSEENTFSVRFTALSFAHALKYRYRLRGLEDKWTETERADARYPGLSGGSYTFEVMVAGRAETGDSAVTSMSFSVNPPWWRSWLFLTACGIAVLSGAGLLWMWRLRRVLEEQRRLEGLVEERTGQVVAEQHKVSEEKRVIEQKNQEIERLLAEAQQATQYKSQFLANMSHEIRTPMNGILAMTEMLLATEMKPEQRNDLELVRMSTVSLLSVINDILDFSKVEAGKLDLEATPFQLREQLSSLMGIFALRAREKGLSLNTRIEGKVPDALVGDSGRLRQILINLIGNAVKFTHRGEVTLFVSLPPQQSEGAEEGTAVLHFTVRDTGIGIPKEQQDVVLEPFRQADGSITRRYGGSGLGLSISSQLARLMGGRMWLESVPGKGSNFHFTARFGVAAPATLLPKKLRRPAMPDPIAHSLRVLVAEDNNINQRVILNLLERKGHLGTLVANGKEAVDAVRRQSFDLVLMDLQMPDMDGFEATAAIRANEEGSNRRVYIVALTASAMVGDKEKCLAAGMDDYIAKPIDMESLNRVLDAVPKPANATSAGEV